MEFPIQHLHDELRQNPARVAVVTDFGPVKGGRAANGAAVFLEIPYALPPGRFEDPHPLPPNFKYEEKDYISESYYAVQPMNDGQARNTPFEDKVGFGKPTENPLFLNIVAPPSFPSEKRFPVKVYIHGGFLQFGSPHGLGSQAQYISAERSEVWVNIGYRLSVFGFTACDKPRLDGNYGFKDQWLALEWIKSNISAFGGSPDDVQITGLSAGAHSVHQILHHASSLPPGVQAPFHSAVLQSNAILTDPKTPEELRPQFQTLCKALYLDPDDPNVLETLKDPTKVSWSLITHVIETEALGTYGTFRGCSSSDWISTSPGPMERQRSGDFARGLIEHGVKSIVVGDLTEEWYLYSIAHPIHSTIDIIPNLERYFTQETVQRLVEKYDKRIPDDAPPKEAERLFGELLSCLQVHLPVRILARDLIASGFPVLRYEIRWTPEQSRSEGYVTHGSDRCLWALRVPNLDEDQVGVAKDWVDKVQKEIKQLEWNSRRSQIELLALQEDKSIGWTKDHKWEWFMKLHDIVPGEVA
ncbi:carboxylesterase [Cyathus striatus]|nr:carboxylesterase [Cyathus striatus]